MAAPGAFARLPVDLLGARPPFRRAKDDHRPRPSFDLSAFGSRCRPNLLDLRDAGVHDGSELPMYVQRLVSLHEVRVVTQTYEVVAQLLFGNPSKDARVGDFVAVEVENRQDT